MRDEFTIERHGKTYVLFAGLLDEAHQQGLSGIDTYLIQAPTEENGQVAVVKAEVQVTDPTTGDVRTFSGIGDASPDNVTRAIIPHLLRMGETRAKARALRDAVNVGAAVMEEEGGDDNAANSSTPSGGRTNLAPVPDEEKADSSTVERIRSLAKEIGGPEAVSQLEESKGKSLSELSPTEADKLVAHLESRRQGA